MLLTLDDVLLEDGAIAPFSRTEANYVAMGRFGNLMLVGGEADRTLDAPAGEVVRLYLTNTANTRVFNAAIGSARMKLVGGDSGRCEREEMVEAVVLAPSERAVVEVLFDRPGQAVLENRTPQRSTPLALIAVADGPADPTPRRPLRGPAGQPRAGRRARAAGPPHGGRARQVACLRGRDGHGRADAGAGSPYGCPMHPEVVSDAPGSCPVCGMKLLPLALIAQAEGERDHEHDHEHDHGCHQPAGGIEWEDDMVAVNRMTTPANTRWKLVDRATGAENAAIDWRFVVGDRVKVRLVNEMDSDHPMHHPFHVHGAGRFLVMSRDGVPEGNLVWKDTVLVRTGETVDLLLKVTNPGIWMAHCHIAEHHESGMMFSFRVDPRAEGA